MVLTMGGVFLLLVSSRVPYRRAKVNFEPNGAQSIGQTAVPLSELEPGALEQLLADPHILAFATFDGHGFWKVETPDDVLVDEMMTVQDAAPEDAAPEAPRGTQAILAEHLRLEVERDRAEAAGPEGDEPPADGVAKTAPAAAPPVTTVAPPAKPPRAKK